MNKEYILIFRWFYIKRLTLKLVELTGYRQGCNVAEPL